MALSNVIHCDDLDARPVPLKWINILLFGLHFPFFASPSAVQMLFILKGVDQPLARGYALVDAILA
jgi:hypothetical protein